MEVTIRPTSGNGEFSGLNRVSRPTNSAVQANLHVWENIANRVLLPEELELMLKRFEKRADERVRRTYVEGQAMQEVDESAVVPLVDMTFLLGTDKPQVIQVEQIGMAGHKPD